MFVKLNLLNNFKNIVKKTIKNEGLLGLYRGVGIHVVNYNDIKYNL